jgi:hypothetical protein
MGYSHGSQQYGKRTRLGHIFTVLQKTSKTDYDKLVKGTSSRITTSVLSRKTQRLVSSFAKGSIRTISTLARAIAISRPRYGSLDLGAYRNYQRPY